MPTLQPSREARWRVSLVAAHDHQRFVKIARALPPVACASASELTREGALRTFLDTVADEVARRVQALVRPERLRTDWEETFFNALTRPAPRVDLPDFLADNLVRGLATWGAPYLDDAGDEAWRLCLKLTPPAEGDTWELVYHLQAVDDPSLFIPLREVWEGKPRQAHVLRERPLPQLQSLLARLGQIGQTVGPVQESLQRPRPDRARFPSTAAWQFLTEVFPLLSESAVSVVVPEELTRVGQQRIRARLRVGSPTRSKGRTSDGRLGLAHLVDFEYEIALGDVQLSAAEFREIVALKRSLVRWRGEWIVVDPKSMVDLQRLANAPISGKLTATEALRAALVGQTTRDGSPVEVVTSGELTALVDRLREVGGSREDHPHASFQGKLRPYQGRGLAWLKTHAQLGLGALLADDMGLGKTIQVIALLLELKNRLPGPTLLVCPTSVLGNWERELARFGPSLSVHRHHGPDRAEAPGRLRRTLRAPGSVLLTTYPLLRLDAELLGQLEYGLFVLDEAQNVKNSEASQARVARGIRATLRIALTGTPVENRLADLWSLMEILNPGLLGPFATFQREIAVPVERYADEAATRRLRSITGPFVLRRVKTDPTIISDLPAKNEMRVHCSLTTEQATLYQAVVDEELEGLKRTRGIQRRGQVLALMMKLKQILNHPAQYLRQTGPLGSRSGKLARLEEMLEEALSGGDRALVFTQFAQMGNLLVSRLSQHLGAEVPFLYGAVPQKKREQMIRAFQDDPDGPPVFVLSLKAGGTGLNLTRANHVFHFDRWWNPAVEDQATDRAFRIGQTRNVQVHKLVTLGTLEEKIDRMLEDKRSLAQRAVGTGETWITELTNEQLAELVRLSDTVVDGTPTGDSPRSRRRS
ncbi:MAG: DEAD/DEAH box helicase [Candidatus Riflebacteria bacterium]|nr:DEAD/DEAH box helicase [Candidatus Riflebacteria bacterium]